MRCVIAMLFILSLASEWTNFISILAWSLLALALSHADTQALSTCPQQKYSRMQNTFFATSDKLLVLHCLVMLSCTIHKDCFRKRNFIRQMDGKPTVCVCLCLGAIRNVCNSRVIVKYPVPFGGHWCEQYSHRFLNNFHILFSRFSQKHFDH